MSVEVKTQPRLYAAESMPFSIPERREEITARVNRLKKLQMRIANRPGIYLGVLAEIPDNVISPDREIHDPAYETRDVGLTPADHLTEFFRKRDVLGLDLDLESDSAIFESNPDEREIMEQYIGRVAAWNAQQIERRTHPQAG